MSAPLATTSDDARRPDSAPPPGEGPGADPHPGEGARRTEPGAAAAPSTPSIHETALARFERGVREGRAIQATLAALAAWTITVAPAAFARGSPASARLLAVLALPAGAGAPLLAVLRRRLARHIGISAFLALSTLTWLLASPAIQPARLDPIRAAIGAVAWGVYALSWRDRWPTGKAPDPDPDAPLLQARSHLPPLAAPLAGLGALAGLALLLVAWRVRDPDRALLAQAVALACAVALTTAAATIAVARGRRHPSASRRLTREAVRPLVVLAAFAVAGAVLMMLR
ncbi:MAG: hypothetical protein IT372_18400 [Polyangiaceae bacterium]|nr:hypothetical protein [Polyangiaceae bacterium]